MFNNGLVSRIHKDLLQLKKTAQFKNGQNTSIAISPKIYKWNKHIGNANQNHSETPLHFHEDGYLKNKKHKQVLVRNEEIWILIRHW